MKGRRQNREATLWSTHGRPSVHRRDPDAGERRHPVFGMTTKLQTPKRGWSGLAIPSELLGRRGRRGCAAS